MKKNILNNHINQSNLFIKKFNKSKLCLFSNAVEILSKKFHKKISDIYSIDVNSLSSGKLHRLLPKKLAEYKNGATRVTDFFYGKTGQFFNDYLRLLKEIRKLIKEDFYFQEYPTFRIHMPHVSAKKYYPYFHSDILFGHPPYEINIFANLNYPTNKEGHGLILLDLKRSLFLYNKYEYSIDKLLTEQKKLYNKFKMHAKLYKSASKNLLLFDTRSFHSVMPLKDHTRISIDVRIVPKVEYVRFLSIYKGTGRKQVKFMPGNAYHRKTIDEFN